MKNSIYYENTYFTRRPELTAGYHIVPDCIFSGSGVVSGATTSGHVHICTSLDELREY